MGPAAGRAPISPVRTGPGRLIDGMLGLGDNIYQRPVVQWLAAQYGRVILTTPWPSLYADIQGVECAPPRSNQLRTQTANIQRERALYRWAAVPALPPARLSYVGLQTRGIPLWRGLCQSVGMPGTEYHLQLEASPLLGAGWVIVHPHTLRLEWPARRRGPDPAVWPVVVEEIRRAGRRIAVAAWIQPPHEVWDGWEPSGVDRAWLRGELHLYDLIRLHAGVDLVVTAVGYPVPLCQALDTPCLVLHGGGRGVSGPAMIDAPARGALHHIEPIAPCRCINYNYCPCGRRLDLDQVRRMIRSALR